jgi:hypothetical protein
VADDTACRKRPKNANTTRRRGVADGVPYGHPAATPHPTNAGDPAANPITAHGSQAMNGGNPDANMDANDVMNGGDPWANLGADDVMNGGDPEMNLGAGDAVNGGDPWENSGADNAANGDNPGANLAADYAANGGNPGANLGAVAAGALNATPVMLKANWMKALKRDLKVSKLHDTHLDEASSRERIVELHEKHVRAKIQFFVTVAVSYSSANIAISRLFWGEMKKSFDGKLQLIDKTKKYLKNMRGDDQRSRLA